MDRDDHLKQLLFGVALVGLMCITFQKPREGFTVSPEHQMKPMSAIRPTYNMQQPNEIEAEPIRQPVRQPQNAEPIRGSQNAEPIRGPQNAEPIRGPAEPIRSQESTPIITTDPGSRFGMSLRPSLSDAMERPMDRVRVRDTSNSCPSCPILPIVEITDNIQREVLAKSFGQVVVLVHQNQRMLLRAFIDLVQHYPSLLFATEESRLGLIPNLSKSSPVLVLDTKIGKRKISIEISNVQQLESELLKLLNS